MGKSILLKQKPKRVFPRLRFLVKSLSWLVVVAGLGLAGYYYLENHASGFDQYRIRVKFLDTLPDDKKTKSKIKKLVEQKAKKADSLEDLASAVHQKFGFSFSNVRLQADEITVSIKRRESLARLVAWQKTWNLDHEGELFPAEKKQTNAILLKNFLVDLHKQPAMAPLGTLEVDAKNKTQLTKALRLIRVAKSMRLKLKTIEYTKGRGLAFYAHGHQTKVIVGHTQFQRKLGRYKQTVAKLGAKKALSIDLDYSNKGIIKYDERL